MEKSVKLFKKAEKKNRYKTVFPYQYNFMFQYFIEPRSDDMNTAMNVFLFDNIYSLCEYFFLKT